MKKALLTAGADSPLEKISPLNPPRSLALLLEFASLKKLGRTAAAVLSVLAVAVAAGLDDQSKRAEKRICGQRSADMGHYGR